jgi:predicted nucleic acid-binding Zn ribbon protein
MKRTEPQSIAEILDQVKSEQNMEGKLLEMRALEIWDEVVGSSISALTVCKDMRKGEMRLRIASAPLRHEIMMSKPKIMDEINLRLGKEVVKDIRFI